MTEEIELYETFFQKSKPYYIDIWTKFKTENRFTFNAFAFLFGIFWLMYRKMYLEAIVVLIAIIAVGIFENLILPDDITQSTEKAINFVVTIAIATVVGFLGNYLYMRKADKIVQDAKIKYPDNEEQKELLTKKGGVNFLFLAVILALIVVIFAYNNYMPNNAS